MFASSKGSRAEMQDYFIVEKNVLNILDVYAVFDGHGVNGHLPAKWCSENIVPIIKEMHMFNMNDNFIHDVCQVLKVRFYSHFGSINSGTTATIVIVNNKSRRIFVAQLGDSKAVIYNKHDEVVYKTPIHTGDNRNERELLENLGYRFMKCSDGVYLCDSLGCALQLTRALGDCDMREFGLRDDFAFINLSLANAHKLIIGSDGLWDVMVPEEAIQYEHSDKLVMVALNRDSDDNICAGVFRL